MLWKEGCLDSTVVGPFAVNSLIEKFVRRASIPPPASSLAGTGGHAAVPPLAALSARVFANDLVPAAVLPSYPTGWSTTMFFALPPGALPPAGLAVYPDAGPAGVQMYTAHQAPVKPRTAANAPTATSLSF
jgi:hypothetical protein